jgi:site-specific DNA-methyltransferase (adenine-specific)
MTNVVYMTDCMDYMESCKENQFDLAIVDPEYGRGEHGGVNRSKYVKQKNGSVKYVDGNKYKKKSWDKKPVSDKYFDELFRVSKNQIIWGVNYYSRNLGSGRIIWDKCNDGSDQSDCEIAFNSMSDKVDIFRYMWRGMMQGKSISEGAIQQGDKRLNEIRIHPTQKPVNLYKFILQKCASPGQTIFDTHVGSGSLRVACYELGFDFTGCEIDIDYHTDQENRFKNHISQQDLFESNEMQKLIFCRQKSL